MGNVLVRFDPELFMDRYSLTGEDRKLIRNEVFRSVEWIMLDRGVIDEEIAEQRILPLLPERLHGAARGLIEKWDDPIVPVEGMLELLQALKAKGYRLYLLSNAATRQPIYWARAEASKLMDGVLISAEVKLLKPAPQIYRTFLHKFALRPEECVFIDDTPINVEGALYENMAGILTNLLHDCLEFIIAFSSRVIQTPILIKRSANERAADIAAHGNSDIRLWNCRNQLGILCLFHVDAI